MSGGMILWNVLLSAGIIFLLFGAFFICFFIRYLVEKLKMEDEELQLRIQQLEKDTSSLFQQLEKEEVP